MPRTTSAPAPGATDLLPGDRLDQVDTTLYHLHHVCALVSAMACGNGRDFTDGLPLEMFAVVFGWLGDEIHDARLHVVEVNTWLTNDRPRC